VYALATLLDPRYKGRLFAPDKLEAIKQWAIDEARFEPSNTHHNRRQRRRRALARWTYSTPYWVRHAAPTSSASAASLVDAQLSAYLQADVISRAESPTEWWAANAAKYPLLAAEAKRYLSASPTSVASEHVFSAAGRIYTDKRLLPKRQKKIEQKSRKKSRFRFFSISSKKSRFSISNSGIVHHYK